MAESAQVIAEKRLSITRETELLYRFLRVNVEEQESTLEDVEEPQTKQSDKKHEDQQEFPRSKQTIPPEVSRKLSKQLTEEPKKKGRKKRRRNGIRNEEVYCDKDRAAAVNLGSKDIKQSLKLKRKQDRSRMLQIPDEAEPSTFLALGNYEMCRGDLQIAINFISKALELNPTEKNSLVARSKCYILLGQPRKALEDAELALQVDKHFLKAIYQKAEALYYLGDFELSLMYYHRGLHVRPDHEGFKLGVHKAQKAIENAIGAHLGIPKKPVVGSGKNTDRSGDEATGQGQEATGKDSPQSKVSKTTTTTRTKTARKTRLLRELEVDKEYLDNLMNNPNLKCKYNEKDTKIEQCIKETVDYLKDRQEFWRQQLPANFNKL